MRRRRTVTGDADAVIDAYQALVVERFRRGLTLRHDLEPPFPPTVTAKLDALTTEQRIWTTALEADELHARGCLVDIVEHRYGPTTR